MKIYMKEQEVIRCSENLEAVLQVTGRLEELLRMYYEEEQLLSPQKAGMLLHMIDTAKQEHDMTIPKRQFLEELVYDFREIRNHASEILDEYEAVLKEE